MGNQQHCILTNNQLQVLLTGFFGDGHITTPKTETSNSYYVTNSIKKEYLDYKKFLLGELCNANITSAINKGFKANLIHTLYSKYSPEITKLRNNSIETNLLKMDDLGLALWFYDDGSLHKTKYFYNLNTHKYSQEINEDLFVPFLRDRFNIKAKTTIERKKDGREFYYLRISKHDGALEIAQILTKYYVPSFDYKIWCSETIQEWSKLQVQLKSEGKVLAPKRFTLEVNRRVKALQDIVQS